MKNKKNKHQQQQPNNQVKPVEKTAGISAVGKKIIFAGAALLVVGYFVLSKTDPAGQNLASTISPFLILGGYAAIAVGIAFPDKRSGADQQVN